MERKSESEEKKDLTKNEKLYLDIIMIKRYNTLYMTVISDITNEHTLFECSTLYSKNNDKISLIVLVYIKWTVIMFKYHLHIHSALK